MGFYQLNAKQFIPAPIDAVWDFISSPANLKRIAPPQMGFEIVTQNLPDRMMAGMIIEYRVKPLAGISTTWVTEITHVRDKEYFIDVQQVGPFSFWHHQHLLVPQDNGVLMTDIVSYKPPLGILGSVANRLLLRRQLEGIFTYRKKALEVIFPLS